MSVPPYVPNDPPLGPYLPDPTLSLGTGFPVVPWVIPPGLYSQLELILAEAEITKVLQVIQTELDNLEASTFADAADVHVGEFGGGGEAGALETHHARAHGVVVDTLAQVVTDLETFRTSIQEARGLVDEADADARVQLEALLAETEGLSMGQDELPDVQGDHANDGATESEDA